MHKDLRGLKIAGSIAIVGFVFLLTILMPVGANEVRGTTKLGQAIIESGDVADFPMEWLNDLDLYKHGIPVNPADFCKYVNPTHNVTKWFAIRLAFKPDYPYYALIWKKTDCPLNATYNNTQRDPEFPYGYYLTTPATLVSGMGNCHDWAPAQCSILLAMGFQAMCVAGYDQTGAGHMYVECRDKKTGKIYFVDHGKIYVRQPGPFNGYTQSWMFNDKIAKRDYKPDWWML